MCGVVCVLCVVFRVVVVFAVVCYVGVSFSCVFLWVSFQLCKYFELGDEMWGPQFERGIQCVLQHDWKRSDVSVFCSNN